MSKADIQIFCEEPTLKNFKFLGKEIQDFFYKKSKKCLEKDIGNIKLTKKVELLYTARDIPEKELVSIRAIFSGMKLLSTKQFLKIRGKLFPRLLLYFKGKKEFSISVSFSKEFAYLFFIDQKDDDIGVDKELNMTYIDSKQYFVDIFKDYPKLKVEKILIELRRGDGKPLFIRNKGIVWGKNLNETVEKTQDELGKEKSVKEYKKVFKENWDKLHIGKKECALCGLLNSTESKKCIACRSLDFVAKMQVY